MEPLKALKAIWELETALHATYTALAAAYAQDADTHSFFENLALDEKAHANLVKIEERTVRTSPELFQLEVDIDMEEIFKLKQTCDYLSKSKAPLQQALEATYKMESSAAELYAFTSLQKANRDIAKFLLQLAGTFKTHYETVERFVTARGINIESIDREKLRRVRVPFTESVLINQTLKVKAVDISEGGLFLLTGRGMPVGTYVTLDFMVGQRRIKAKCRVQFEMKGLGVGVSFSHVHPDDMAVIKAYIDKTLGETVITGETTSVLLISSKNHTDTNMRIYSNNLIASGYKSTAVTGFIDTALLLNKNHGFNAIVIYVENEDDDNFKLVTFIKQNDQLKHFPVLVISPSHSIGFEQKVIGEGAKKLLRQMETNPKKLLSEINIAAGKTPPPSK